MSHQAIVYDKRTGQILYVLDPGDDTPPERLHALLWKGVHEEVVIREKGPRNRLHEWQEHVSRHCGLMPKDVHSGVKDHVHANVPGVTET